MSDKLEADNERSIVCTSNKSMPEEKKGNECERVVFMKEVLQSQAARQHGTGVLAVSLIAASLFAASKTPVLWRHCRRRENQTRHDSLSRTNHLIRNPETDLRVPRE
jgi:hypothetical protein